MTKNDRLNLGLFSDFRPFGVERSGLIGPFICMSSEEITLSLKKIGRQPRAAIGIKISQTRTHTRSTDTNTDSKRNNSSPCSLTIHYFMCKFGINQKTGQLRIPIISLLNPIQKYGSDYTPTFPDPRNFSKIEQWKELTIPRYKGRDLDVFKRIFPRLVYDTCV